MGAVLTFKFCLLESHFFFLPLDDFRHIFHVILSTDEPDFLETAPSDFKVKLTVAISLGKVVYLLKEDVRDDFHVVGLGVLTHREESVLDSGRLAHTTDARDRRIEATHAERISVPLHGF